MATKGTSKWFSQQQEARVAKAYRGTVSPSSGASVTDPGDVRTPADLIECKHRGTFDKPARSISVKLDDLEKIHDEALTMNRYTLLCLSVYCPSSSLANNEGYVDLSVRPMLDDATNVMHLEDLYGK